MLRSQVNSLYVPSYFTVVSTTSHEIVQEKDSYTAEATSKFQKNDETIVTLPKKIEQSNQNGEWIDKHTDR